MFCRNCGNEVKDGVKFCPVCGEPTEERTQTDPARGAQNPGGMSSGGAGSRPDTGGSETDVLAIVSLILGIVSIVLAIAGPCALSIPVIVVALVCGILAIVMSSISKKNHGSSGFATAGLVLGIIGLIIAAIVLVAVISCVARVSSCTNAFYNALE